jgi:hypothetical protein
MRSPGLRVENPDGLLEVLEHSFPYRSRADSVKLTGPAHAAATPRLRGRCEPRPWRLPTRR